MNYKAGFLKRWAMEARGRRWLFRGKFVTLQCMDKQQHAALLRRALEESPQWTRQTLADATGRNYRTVSNWISASKPTLPSGEERAMLRRLFPNYDAVGDHVERALRQSELIEWRQDSVLSAYKRHLHEQRSEVAG